MSRTNHRNYYRLLHVQPDAPLEVIKASYRALMRSLKHHPDLGGDQWDAALINEAYEVLSAPEKRKTYDRERRSLGNGLSQIARSPSRATHNRAKLVLVSSIHLASPEPVRLRICAFCDTENGARRRYVDEVCGGCGGPLERLVDFTLRDSNTRSTRRIDHQADIHYRVDSSSPDATSAQVVDLSPTGLRFLARQQLTPGDVIKIDSLSLSAIAEVVRSTEETVSGFFTTGVRFLTLKLRRPRGTFVSEKV